MIKVISRRQVAAVFASMFFSSGSVWAAYCNTDTNLNHVSAGRAETYFYNVYAQTVGSGDELGLYYSDSSTLEETSPGYFEEVASCGAPVFDQPTAPYPHSSELNANDVFNIEGNYGVAIAGGHLVDSTNGNIPWETKTASDGSVTIPAGSTIKHAFLYYSGSIALEGGDFTPDNLNNIDDVRNNGITFTIGTTTYGPFDTNSRQPSGQSSVGSESQMLPATVFDFGTLTDTATSFWGNRLDITGEIQNQTDNFTIHVDAPEQIDISANNASSNNGNPAGNTDYNTCSSVANWSILVIYENAAQSPQQVILKDQIIRAWDYTFIHNGTWERPFVTFDHEPMKLGSKFYTYAATGIKAGTALPSYPTCTCGCGGQYILKKTGSAAPDPSSNFWSTILLDPEEVHGDPMHRDASNGPWSIATEKPSPVNGNDWTLFQSGGKFTEFPNLYEGENVAADNVQPITNEDSGEMAGDVYDGHPWGGRGDVTYHGWGNSTSVLEVALDDSAISVGETQTKMYFKGDQKDVFKPQSRMTLRYLVLTIPTDGVIVGSAPPELTLSGLSSQTYTEGEMYNEDGYTATDDVDGDLTGSVDVSCDFAISSVLAEGNYNCTYTVTDSDANTTTRSRSITVEGIVTVASCYSAKLSEHASTGRAYDQYYSYYSTGTAVYLGSTFIDANKVISLEETTPGSWASVSSCP